MINVIPELVPTGGFPISYQNWLFLSYDLSKKNPLFVEIYSSDISDLEIFIHKDTLPMEFDEPGYQTWGPLSDTNIYYYSAYFERLEVGSWYIGIKNYGKETTINSYVTIPRIYMNVL